MASRSLAPGQVSCRVRADKARPVVRPEVPGAPGACLLLCSAAGVLLFALLCWWVRREALPWHGMGSGNQAVCLWHPAPAAKS